MLKTTWMVFLLLLAAMVLMVSGTIMAQEDKQKIEIGEYRLVDSHILGEKRRVWVHLPENYKRSNQRYPVIYKCDAISIFLFSARVSDLNSYSIRKQVPRFILVSIENTDRSRDMYPPNCREKIVNAGANKFLQFFKKELIPFIESRYRTDGYRVLMGESNSAMFTVYGLLKNPKLFHGYIASSPELNWCYELFSDLATNAFAERDFSRSHLYMIYGAKDNERVLESVPRFVELLKAKAPADFRWHLDVLPDAGHVPAESMKKGLTYIFEGYKAPIEVIEKGPEAIEKYYADFNKKMGHPFNVPGNVWVDYAQVLLRQKKPAEALKLLMETGQKYSEGPVVVNAMLMAAGLYSSMGQTDMVIKCYRRAMEFSPPMEGFLKAKIDKLLQTKKDVK